MPDPHAIGLAVWLLAHILGAGFCLGAAAALAEIDLNDKHGDER